METADTIAGKVAAIIDDTTLVLNVGDRDGVREGQWFAIVSAHGEVCDPDTGESLGRWESVKGRVVVTHVQERMATARSPQFEDPEHSTGTLSTMMVRHSFGMYGERERDRQRLQVGASSVTGRPATQPIEVGDTVRSVALEGLSAEAKGTEPPDAAPDLPSQSYAASSAPPEEGDE
jgi:hypothetical protein